MSATNSFCSTSNSDYSEIQREPSITSWLSSSHLNMIILWYFCQREIRSVLLCCIMNVVSTNRHAQNTSPWIIYADLLDCNTLSTKSVCTLHFSLSSSLGVYMSVSFDDSVPCTTSSSFNEHDYSRPKFSIIGLKLSKAFPPQPPIIFCFFFALYIHMFLFSFIFRFVRSVSFSPFPL